MSGLAARTGEVVRLGTRWGRHHRNRCPRCHHYMASGQRPICRSCGAQYVELAEDFYLLAEGN